jgi:transcriptional regulator with XRE-family HTH domain
MGPLRRMRVERGLRAQDVVEALRERGMEIHLQTLRAWERGRPPRDPRAVLTLAEVFGVPASQVVSAIFAAKQVAS